MQGNCFESHAKHFLALFKSHERLKNSNIADQEALWKFATCFDINFCLLRPNLIVHAHTDLCKAYKSLSCILSFASFSLMCVLYTFSSFVIQSDSLPGKINR